LLLVTLDKSIGNHLAADALSRLIELGLVEAVGQDGARMHRLLVAFIRQIGDDPQAQAAVEEVMLEVASQLNATEDVPRLLAVQNHLRAITDVTLLRNDEQAANLCFQLSLHLEDIEDLEQEQYYNQESLNIRRLLGDEHPALTPNLHHHGWILDCLSREVEALVYHERALAIRRAALGDEHLAMAESLNYVGTVLHAQCNYTGARAHYEQALAIRKRLLGPNHPETAQSCNNLGLLLHAVGRYVEALAYHEQALTIREQMLLANHSRIAITLNNPGYVLRAMARYTEARPYLDRALAIRIVAGRAVLAVQT
jgi:tetratricopeptide (TPR) repeat protein